jgi:hypothetical protein
VARLHRTIRRPTTFSHSAHHDIRSKTPSAKSIPVLIRPLAAEVRAEPLINDGG